MSLSEFRSHSGPTPATDPLAAARIEAQTLFLAKVFNWMAVGLALTAMTAYGVAASPAVIRLIYGNPLLFFGLVAVEIGMVYALAGRIERLSAATATGLFVAYAVLNGVTLATIFLVYTMTSIAATFVVTAVMFGAMALYGFLTKRDLTSLGSFVFMGLVGIVVAAVVNLFLASPMLSWLISGVGVIVFTGLTAYDVQRLARFGAGALMGAGGTAVRRGAILGALSLYLDFVNLFLMLLYFLGGRRD